MATQTTTGPTSDTDEILKQTELGEVIAKYKSVFISLLVLLILGVFGYGIYSEQAKKSKIANAKLIYDFSNTKLAEFKDKKIEVKAFITQLKTLSTSLDGDVAILPLILEVTEELELREDSKSAFEVLGLTPALTNPYSEFFYLNKKVELLEDQGEFKTALETIEKLSPEASMLLEEKVFLDKGRLNMKLGNMAEAKKNFELVTAKVGQEEFVKLAKIYLDQIERNNVK